MQCNRFSKFQEFADSKSSSPLKFAKNSHSHTANIRMLGDCVESLDTKVDSTNLDTKLFKDFSVESNLDSALDSKDSIKEDSNPLESHNDIKSSNPQSF